MVTHGVTVRQMRMLRGPNLYAYMPVLQAVIDIGEYEKRPSSSFPGCTDRLLAWLPELQKHECSPGRPGGFVERLRRGTYLAHIVEHITIELQSVMGFDVTFGRARGTGESGVYNVVIAYREEEPVKAAFQVALRLTLAAMHDEPFDIAAELRELETIADKYRLGPSTSAIVEAARRRSVPVLRLTETSSLVQLGYGIHQKRIQASETSNTSAIAVSMCQEKPLTNQMLRAVGVPVPDGRSTRSVDEACEIARELGFPVVVKPEAGNQGKGVSVNLQTESEVRAAFEIARNYDSYVLVERFIQGEDFRLLVVNGKMVAAARRDPAQVTGDGEHTVAELVELLNQDPRRRPGHSGVMTRVTLDESVDLVLGQQGLSRNDVPTPGQAVLLRTNSNLSTGGTATDMTDEVHPRNARMAELAAQILALDVAGIDVLCHDIRRPLEEQNGAVVECNAAPGLRMHLHPAQGKSRDVGKPIVRMLYPTGAPSRIPIIAVTGTNGKTTVTRLISHMYETAHRVVGMTCTDGIYINSKPIVRGDCSGPKSARTILLHPQIEVAVLETARGGILREGLAFDRCTVGVVTNISADHLGMGGVNTVEDLARVKQVVIEAVERDGAAVLNAEDPLVAEMVAATDARVVYFSTKLKNHVIQAHLADGGAAVVAENGFISLVTGEDWVELVDLERIPFTRNGKIGFQVKNALAATAAAWAAGLNPAMIVRALTTFKADTDTTPGRFNVFDMEGVEVILDYGHNEGAMKGMADAVGALDKMRTTVVCTLPGDRRDENLVATFKATLPFADAYFLHDSHDRRGRAEFEVPRLLQQHVPEGVPCTVERDQQDALRRAWHSVHRGERLIVVADLVEETLALLRDMAKSGHEENTCSNPVCDPATEGSRRYATAGSA